MLIPCTTKSITSQAFTKESDVLREGLSHAVANP